MIAYRTRRHTSAPLRHIGTSTPASKTGKNVLAVCGTSVAAELGQWDPAHPRACRECVAWQDAQAAR